MGTRSDLDGGLLGSRLCYSSDEAFFGLPPVDDLPHLGQILGTSVLVIKVVCVLPDVHVDNWYQEGAHVGDQVLVVGSPEREHVRFLVVYKPSPTRALDSSSSLVEDFDEFIDGSPAF